MVSIQGAAQHISRSLNVKRKKSEKISSNKTAAPSVVASAVAQGIRSVGFPYQGDQEIGYDLPDGKNAQALALYLSVKHHAKREELMALFGVDICV